MKLYYGDQNALRALEEAEFWKRQESEHTIVIQEVVPDLEDEYVNKLVEYKNIFDSTEGKLVNLSETVIKCKGSLSPAMLNEINDAIEITIRQSQVFIDFLGRMIRESDAVKNDMVAITVINHIIRESEYFIGSVSAYINNNCMDNDRYY